jgi:hypothetical protein
MKRNINILLAIACLALAVLACQTLTGASGGGNTPDAPTTGAPQQGEVILNDDFSAPKWGVGKDKDSSIEYVDQALKMIVYTKNYFVWSMPNDTDYENIHIEATAINNNTDPATAFGIMCDQQVTSDAFYYFAVTPAGQYAIAKAAVAQDDVILTNNGKFEKSNAVKANAPSYRIGADCGNGTLTLYVEGQQVASVADASYTKGGVALFTWSGEQATNTDVSFDDFVMHELK